MMKDTQQVLETLLQNINRLQQEGDLDASIAQCNRALELNPNAPEIYSSLGKCLMNQGELEQALEAYNRSIELAADFFEGYFGLSVVSFKQNKLDAALAAAKQALELNAKNKWLYHHLGRTLAKDKQLEQAADAFKQAITLDPKFTVAYKNLGDLLFKQAKFSEAAEVYLQAVELGDSSAELYTNLGSIYLKQEEWEKTVNFCSQAIEFKTNSPWTYYNLGFAYHNLGNQNQAIANYAKALEIDPGFSPAYQRLMFSRLNPEQLNEVVAAFRHNIQQKPGSSWLYTRLGDLLTKQGDVAGAIANYQQATQKLVAWHKPDYARQYWSQGTVQGPDFMIIGAMKAGTTSLYEYLCQHPQVLHCAQKEVHFFVHHFDKGLEWYLSHFPPVVNEAKFIVGEASPGYFCNTIQEQVKSSFPEAKFLVILRNPVARAISHYYHNVKYGLEMRSFEAAMNAELEAVASLADTSLAKETANWSQQQGYLFTGLYVYFVQKWLATFPREQFLIIKSEDLYQHPVAIMKQTFDFLEIPDYQEINYINYLQGSYSQVDHSWQAKLSDFFQPYNQKLEQFLGMEFNWD